MGAPPSAGIQSLHPLLINSFKAGRVTAANLTEMTPEMSLIATNVLFLENRGVSKRPGYTLVRQYPQIASVLSLHDFQRSSDQAQFLIVQQPKYLFAGDVQGLNVPQQLSSTEDPAALFSYVDFDFACYLSNGKASYRLVDNAGVLTKYKWGIAAPAAAPNVIVVSGTVTVVYGWQYSYCYVSKITDAEGVTRVSVSAPSPTSASTGPFVAGQVNGSGIVASTDPQVTHIWIFRTFDTPVNTTSTFNFDQEITNGTATFADSLPDVNLDQTRPVPLDNYPAPLAKWVFQYANRPVAIGITGAPQTVQLGGFSEILVGIPQEAWPQDLFFEVPGGKQSLSAGIRFEQRCMLGTASDWWALDGQTPATFTLRDHIMQPGCAGFKLVLSTEKHLIWLSPDKALWAWDGTYPAIPVEVSKKLAVPTTGVGLSMEDLSSDQLSECELRWFIQGRFKLIALVASSATSPTGTKDWIQLWDASFLGDTLSDNTVAGMAESDFFPSDLLTASDIVQVKAVNFIFMGDQQGNIYRWPDGYQDNGKSFAPVWGSIWSGLSVFIGPMFHPLPPQETLKQIFFADIQSDRQDAATAFRLLGLAAPSPNSLLKLLDCGLGPFIQAGGTDPTSARAQMQGKPGLAAGRWARYAVLFPDDNNDATLWSLAVWARPIFGGAP